MAVKAELTSAVNAFINGFNIKKFMEKSGREQNQILYNKFRATTNPEKVRLRVIKKRYIDREVYNVSKVSPPKPSIPTKQTSGKSNRQKPKARSKTKNPSSPPGTIIIYEEGHENGMKGGPDKYDGIEINEQFVERVIRSTVKIAELKEDPGILLKAGALAFSLLKEKKALALGTGEEHEYSVKELKAILGDEEF